MIYQFFSVHGWVPLKLSQPNQLSWSCAWQFLSYTQILSPESLSDTVLLEMFEIPQRVPLNYYQGWSKGILANLIYQEVTLTTLGFFSEGYRRYLALCLGSSVSQCVSLFFSKPILGYFQIMQGAELLRGSCMNQLAYKQPPKKLSGVSSWILVM